MSLSSSSRRSRREVVIDALPAVGFFTGTAFALLFALVDPALILSVGTVVFLGCAASGIALRWALTGGGRTAPVSAYDLVIFDCDGVLVDSEVLSNEALRETLAALEADERRGAQKLEMLLDPSVLAEPNRLLEEWDVGELEVADLEVAE